MVETFILFFRCLKSDLVGKERTILESFAEQTVQFTYPNNLDDFNYLIDFFMSERMPSEPENEGELGERTQINKLIVMDDVSGLADRCEDFSNFLTVSRKYGFSLFMYFILFIQEDRAGK